MSINKLVKQKKNINQFSKSYIDYLKKIFLNIKINSISRFEKEFNELKKKIYFICFWKWWCSIYCNNNE